MASEQEICWWYLVQNLLEEITRATELLTVFKNSLYSSDVERDRRIFHNLYCFQCRGLCQDKVTSINHLRSLSRELDNQLFAISDVLFQKCLPASPACSPTDTDISNVDNV